MRRARSASIYDDRYVTREETPPTRRAVRQAAHALEPGISAGAAQGRLAALPRAIAAPAGALHAGLPAGPGRDGTALDPCCCDDVRAKLPVGIAMLSLLPLYALAFQYAVNLVGLFEFGRAYSLRLRPRHLATFTLGFIPYQLMLAGGAIRAVYRERRGHTNWEKTAHTGAHRDRATVNAKAPATSLEGD